MEQQPFFRDLTGGRTSEIAIPAHDVAEAARVATSEEMDRIRALGRPRREMPELEVKEPALPADFETRIAALDEEIFARGIAIDRKRLTKEGRERFDALLALDRKARSWQRIVDLTRWHSVQSGLHVFECSQVPQRKTIEIIAGSSRERDEVRKIYGWNDLWKASGQVRREEIDDVCAFHEVFSSLVFGQSMLEKLGKDGRLRTSLFCGGAGRKVDLLLRDWLSVIQGDLSSVTLLLPRWSLVAWLANEQAPPQSTKHLACEFFNLRAPRRDQVQVAESIFDGFLLGYDGWHLWQYVGRRTRSAQDHARLSSWRTALSKRYRAIADWQSEVKATFYNDVGYGTEHHQQFDDKAYRAFIDRTARYCFDCVYKVLALALAETLNCTVVARFEGAVLCDGKPKQRAAIAAQLEKVFPSARFELQIEQLQS
jgi:hypothetical protein